MAPSGAGAGFVAPAALIVGTWRPKGLVLACLLFGLSSAIAQRLPVYSESLAILFEALPCILTLVAVAGIVGRPRRPAGVGGRVHLARGDRPWHRGAHRDAQEARRLSL